MKKPVRISKRVLSHLSGSQAWQSPKLDYNSEEEVKLMEKLQAANPRKDGSVHVALDADERACLYEYTDVMAIGARDNIEPPGYSYDGNDALSDYNAAAGLIRQLEKIRWEECKK